MIRTCALARWLPVHRLPDIWTPPTSGGVVGHVSVWGMLFTGNSPLALSLLRFAEPVAPAET